ncbi:myosin head motor domain containing protein [Nitzschia inconspicua]|uniref:Myosin head motor domain containing protein n=1 Tax=Nitzschia inconspicua TaxID=303405 RepID=A0A9K3L1I6_9STRA|nr:myosin head motor domain containing protein [Nitzschia inconspicua]
MESNKGSWGNRLRENLEYAASLAASLKEEQSSPDLFTEDREQKVDREGTLAHSPSKGEKADSTSKESVATEGYEAENSDKLMFRSLFSDAAETWIQGQTSNGSDIPEPVQNSSYEESSHDYEADEEIDSASDEIPAMDDAEDAAVSVDGNNAIGATLSTSSTQERGNTLGTLKSFDTNSSLGTSSHASFDSEESVEIEMDADLHGSWATVGPDSQASSSFSSLGDAAKVYIRDEQFCWLPATVLEYKKHSALVALDLPATWEKSTFTRNQKDLSNVFNDIHPSLKKVPHSELDILVSEYGVPANMLRQVIYNDYEKGDLPKQNAQGSGKRNMEDLFHQHPPAILYNLKERHYLQQPYTRVGDIMIAMNPFVWIDELYHHETRDLYSRHLIWNAIQEQQIHESDLKEHQSMYDRLGFDPHVYEVSALAYRGLARSGQDQTILVTGESGAGKTETVKIVMDHLATVQLTRPEGVDDEHDASKDVVDRVIKSSPVFEAFGNAKTVRNNNSSRFGKFIQLQYRVEPLAIAQMGCRDVPYTDLVGSKVSTYLLEKNRVVFHADGERTFHIFYQLLSAPAEFKEQLWPFFSRFGSSDFKYTAETKPSEVDDSKLWVETLEALGLFKFKNDSLLALMQALCVILQLGNLVFVDGDSEEHHQSSQISSREQLDRLSIMIGISQDELQETMTTRTIKTPGCDHILVKLTPESAKEACDAFAKEMYSRIFDHIVYRINEYTMFPEPRDQHLSNLGHISLLDIFGFESFDVNRFEQLCINYTNEKLQHQFVLDNFNQIKREYIDEGVDLFDFRLVDNSETLHLLEGRHGLITTLNEECLLPKGKDESFVYKVKNHQKVSSKLINQKLDRPFEFGVEHFAGTVIYDARSFVQTNMDKLPENLLIAATRSSNSLIKEEFAKLLAQRDAHGEGSKTANKRKKEADKTVMQKFQRQLKELVAAMDGTKTRYIRCIKANAAMLPKVTDHLSTMRQLECSGLMTTLIISRESFPQKLTYDFILTRYACLMVEEQLKTSIHLDRQDKVRYMLSKWLKPLSKKNRDGSRTMPFACGKTKVFFRPGAQDLLENRRQHFYENSSRAIQTWFRRVAAIKLLALRRQCMYKIQSFGRKASARIRLKKQQKASTVLSSWIRCQWAVMSYQTKHEKVMTIQSAARRWSQEKKYKRVKEGAVVIQSVIRMSLVLSRMVRLNAAVCTISQWIRGCWSAETKRQIAAGRIQTNWRAFTRRNELRAATEAATLIQKAWRRFVNRMILASKAESEQGLDGALAAQDDKMWLSTSSINSSDSLSSSMPFRSVELHHINCKSNFGPINIDENLVLQKKLQEATERERKRAVELEELQSIFSRRVADLTKANDGLVKEVFKLRQDCEVVKKQRRLDALQMDSQLTKVQQEMERIRRKYEKKIQTMERRALDTQRKHDAEVTSKQKELSNLETKHTYSIEKLRDELRKTQVSHQEYLEKLMNILETTQAMRETETAKISADLRAIKKEKDDQIFMLQQELRAARAAKGIVINNVEPKYFIDAYGMKSKLNNDADEIAMCSQQFNDTVEKLANLITASNALPPAVGPHNMAEVAQQQDSAQRMMEMVGVLIDLYSVVEERNTHKNEGSLAAINDYIALSEPDETIRELRKRLAEIELQNERLRNELQEKESCRKCAIREEAARRRLGR